MKRVVSYGLVCLLVGAITGCPTSFTLGFPGELPVARVFVDDIGGVDPISIYYPDTDPPMENLPVVIINTGWNQPRLAYDGYATQLAQWGFVCVVKFVASAGLTGIGDARVTAHVAQNSALLDWLELQNQDPDSFLFGMLDTNNAGIVGHSLGAGIAIDTALVEPRFKSAISLDGNFPGPEFDPREGLPDASASFLFFYATQGRWCSGQRFDAPRLFEFTSPDAIEVSIIGASHIDFMDSIIGLTYVAPFACPRGSQDAQVVRDIATRYMVSWFNVYLKGLDEFKDNYMGESALNDVNGGLVTIRYNLAE